jgi:hypothetical protein
MAVQTKPKTLKEVLDAIIISPVFPTAVDLSQTLHLIKSVSPDLFNTKYRTITALEWRFKFVEEFLEDLTTTKYCTVSVQRC